MLRKAGITDDFLKCFETGERVSAVRYYTSKWGRTIYLRYIVSPIQDEAGSVTQVQALVEDYTEKKNAEDALLRSEQRYRNLFETMVQGVFYQNRDGYITNANQAALEILGVSEEEIRQRSIFSNDWKAIDENGKALMPEEYPSMKAISTGSEVENIILGIFNKKDEEFRWLSVSAKPQFTTDKGKSNEAFVTMHDITARKRAEIELRNSEERFQALIEQAPDAIYMHDSDGRIVLFNKKASQMTGYSADQLRQMHISNLEIKYSLEELKEKWNRLLHQKSMRIEGLHKRQNGDIFPVDVNLSFMQIHGRTLIIGFARDISDRKRTENALRESEEKYRKLVDNSLLGFYLIRKGILLYCNKTFADIFGYDQSELINSPVRKCIADESWNKVAQELRLREEGIKDYSQYELHGVRKNGEIIDCEAFGRRIDYQGKPAVQGIIIDITEKNKSREELQKIARLESLGVLAGGIAHNFKNMLTSMSLSVELGRIKRKRIDEYLDKLEKSIAQATALANRFQSFSRGGDPVKEMININQIVEEAVSLSLSGSNITADMQLDPHLWETAADPRQMHEVFTNLIINARQAMPKGGNINIETHNARQQIEEGETPGEANMIKIVVEDQGIGIPKDIINNIFDPFFTTKEEGHGLGLASVHYIIRKHGGTIRASSKMGVGARFDIYLPAIVESQNETEDNIIQENYFDEPVNVLLMDDNADIRENLIDFGEEFNLKITGVANGSQCLEKYKEAIEKDKKFEVVILDLTIEGSKEGGLDTLRQLQKIDENVKAIVFSGHSSLPVVANYEDYGFAGCLEKPINIDHFCKEIQKIVEE
jgi:PAS domain S-box-containing protein